MVAPGDFGTLVALRAKQGEFMALDALDSAKQVRHLQPLLELDASGKSPADQLDGIEAIVRKLHGFGRHVMLDASEVAHPTAFGGGTAGALGELADRLSHPIDLFGEQDPISFIPVVRSDAGDDRLSLVGHLCDELEVGGALRVRTQAQASVERIFERLRVDPAELDLIVDLQYVDKVTSQLTENVSTTLSVFAQFGPFRSTSLLSGSIPPVLSQTAAWQQPRLEELLWESAVQDGAGYVRLADYGVVHPVAGNGFRSKHVSMKYTCPDHWLYLRERMSESEESQEESARAHTFRLVCRNLVDSESFSGPDFSWGDQEMATAAQGRGHSLGSTSKPVAFATSHHLACLASRAVA
jgi:hypothetical protein